MSDSLPWDRFGDELPYVPPAAADAPPSPPPAPRPEPAPHPENPAPAPPPEPLGGVGRDLVKADARSRSGRTFIQGLIFDLFAGLVAVVATLAGADPFVKETWIAFGVLLLKTFVAAGISYVMRLRVTPTMKTAGTKLAIMPMPRPMIPNERGA